MHLKSCCVQVFASDGKANPILAAVQLRLLQHLLLNGKQSHVASELMTEVLSLLDSKPNEL